MAFIQLKKCLTDPKHLVKLIALIVCCCVTLYQLTECVRKIIHPPVSTYYKFLLNDTIKYPAVTACRKPAYKTEKFSDYGITSTLHSERAFESFPFETQTIKGFLEDTTYAINELVYYAYKGIGLSPKIEKVSRYHLTRGHCVTLIPSENSDIFGISGGYLFYFKHNAKDQKMDAYGMSLSGFDIFIHHQDEVVTDDSDQDYSFMDYIYLQTSEDMHVRLELKTFSSVSSPNEPCNSEPGYSISKCREQCLHQQIADTVGCTLPWLNVPEVNYTQCSSYGSVKYLISGFNSMNKTRFLKNCNCLIPCTIAIYTTTVLNRGEADNFTKPGSIMNIYFVSNLITQMEEVIGYDWNTFLSDIGGSLGFLLGLSVIGIITVIEQIIQIFWISKKKENEEGKSEKKIRDNVNIESIKTIMEFLTDYDFYEKQIIGDKENSMQKAIK